MTDPDTVATALARLADGDVPSREVPTRIVAEAETAMGSVDSAATFVDAGGEASLRRVVRAAEQDGNGSLAERGRDVLAALAAFRDAAERAERPVEAHGTTSTPLAQPSSREGA